MVQLGTPASDLRKQITSTFPGGMTAAQLEEAVHITPQITRFNHSRRRLQAPRTPDSHVSKDAFNVGGNKTATASKSTPIVQSPEFSAGEDLSDENRETSVTVPADDVQKSILKPTDTFDPPSHEDIPRAKQRGGTLPRRFLRTIAKRKEMRREKRKESKLAASFPVEETFNTTPREEKGDEYARPTASHEAIGGAEVDILVTGPEPPSNKMFDDSQESTSLEEIIRTAPRLSNSQASKDPGTQDISLSFGPSRLVRRTGMDSGDDNSDDDDDDDDEELSNLEIAILDLADGAGSSRPKLGPDNSNNAIADHKSQKGHQSSQKECKEKKEKKRPRRLPVNELYLVSERVQETSQEKDDENEQSSADLPDDPISQDTLGALQVIDAVGRTKHERKTLQTWNYGAFGRIDTRAYRFPTPHNASPQAEAKVPLEVSPSHSDGFVGSEANSTGRFMPMPKQKRISVTIWGLTTRVGQLDLVCERGHKLIDEPTGQAENKRSPNKKIAIIAPVLFELESQAGETVQIRQTGQENQKIHEDHQDDRYMPGYLPDNQNTPNVEYSSSLSQSLKVSRKVTFEERVQVAQRARTPLLDPQKFGEFLNAKERHNSLDSRICQEIAMVRLKRCHSESSEDDGSSVDESDRSVVSISSDSDGTEESEEISEDNNEEMDEGQEIAGDFDVETVSEGLLDSDTTSISDEEESSEVSEKSDEEIDGEDEEDRGEYFNVQAVLKEQVDSQIGATRISCEDDLSEVGERSKEDDSRNDMHNSDEGALQNEQVVVEGDAVRISTIEELSQCKENSAEPFEDLIPDESQITEADTNGENGDSQPSQLSIIMSWKNTQTIQEADIWRPRKPRSSSVMNETEEDIVDSPSPVFAIAKRRKSSGLQARRRGVFGSRPLALTISRPSTSPSPEIEESQIVVPEIPETQFIATRDVSPELGESQASNMSNELEDPISNALLPGDHEGLSPRFSQLSFVPDEIPEQTYFCRASQLLEEYQTPKSRSKSTPGRFHPVYSRIALPTSAQPTIGTTASEAFEARTSPKFSQQSYQPTPRSEKSLSRLTRQASFAFGTLPVSARKRTKTLPFVPPFKRPNLSV
ncbi:hypothetical protein SBOR_4213 [Sclerotinia borealis F-4128]|uniref:Uncharacterized protein n=1 Tax=Sclerotinia borealis (strain F-4128) TaxID=1432307 RepID=W9CF49_SCLBF|nr:hypothetical protein SBOR_4213 [Sclerotinia borealis F-4128]